MIRGLISRLLFDVPAIYEDENSSHEVQFNYTGDGLNVVGGVYYYDGESCGQFEAILGFLGRAAFGTPGLTREVNGCNNTRLLRYYRTIICNHPCSIYRLRKASRGQKWFDI